RGEWGEQLQVAGLRRITDRQHRLAYPLLLIGPLMDATHAEHLLVVRDRRVQVGDGHPDVVDAHQPYSAHLTNLPVLATTPGPAGGYARTEGSFSGEAEHVRVSDRQRSAYAHGPVAGQPRRPPRHRPGVGGDPGGAGPRRGHPRPGGLRDHGAGVAGG